MLFTRSVHRLQMKFGDGCLVVAEGTVSADIAHSVLVRVTDARSHCEHARQKARTHPRGTCRPPLRQTPIRRRGLRRPSLDLHAIHRRHSPRTVGRHSGETVTLLVVSLEPETCASRLTANFSTRPRVAAVSILTPKKYWLSHVPHASFWGRLL